MEEMETYNIPAFKRKRSIAAKARKTQSSTSATTPVPQPQTSQSQTTISKTPKTIRSKSSSNSSLKANNQLIQSQEREMKICGTCDGYFEGIEVAIIKLTNPIRVGDVILIEKQDGLFEQEVNSMQINRKDVSLARTGSDVGLKVRIKPKVGGTVYKVVA